VTFRGCLYILPNGYDTLCSVFVVPVVIFLQRRVALQLTMTAPRWPTDTTIILQVKFLVVCEIVAHPGPHIPISPGDCIFVDHAGLNTRITTTEQTDRSSRFRQQVMQRDGVFCVITRALATECHAAHLIPRSKGNEVMFMILLCDPLMMVCSSISRGLSNVVLPCMIMIHHLQFLGLMMFRMECCWPRPCI
jgi:hypothetical protein